MPSHWNKTHIIQTWVLPDPPFLNYGAHWTAFLSQRPKFLLTSSLMMTFATCCADGPPLGTQARGSGGDQKRQLAPCQQKAYHKKQTTQQQSHSDEKQETQQVPVSKQENCLPFKCGSQIKQNTDNNIPSGTVCIPWGATRQRGPRKLWWYLPGIRSFDCSSLGPCSHPQPRPEEKGGASTCVRGRE